MVGYYDPREEIQIIGVTIDTTEMNRIEALAAQITVYEQIDKFNNAMRLENRYKKVCERLKEYENGRRDDCGRMVSVPIRK